MNPWTIIGWFVLCVGAIILLALVVGHILWRLAEIAMHVRTREDPPQPGDVWVQSWVVQLRVQQVVEGRVVFRVHPYGTVSQSESLDEWRQRILENKMWRSLP